MLLVDDSPEQAQDIYRGRFESCFREHHARPLAAGYLRRRPAVTRRFYKGVLVGVGTPRNAALRAFSAVTWVAEARLPPLVRHRIPDATYQGVCLDGSP